MDLKIFNSIGTYMDMYRYLSESKRSKDELIHFLVKQCGKSDSTARAQIKKAEDGDVAFVQYDSQGYALNKDAFTKALSELEAELGLKPVTQMVKKKPKPEDEIPSVLSGHSPEFKQMRESVNDVGAMEKRYKEELAKKDEEIVRLKKRTEEKVDDLLVAYARQKIIVLSSVKVKPEELFQKDFFQDAVDSPLSVDELLNRYGEKAVSSYEPDFKLDQELTTDNYIRRIMKLLFGGELLRKRFGKQIDVEETKKGKQEKTDSEVAAERKRLESINEIMAMEHVPNQVKLALYASWFTEEDPEMAELLLFAGKYDINANYVIRILEKPRDCRNYRTMRGLLQQAKEASEAHIKREAALELISGDWYVEAEYKGKPCRFSMMPVDEMQEFLHLLECKDGAKAAQLLEHILTEGRSAVLDMAQEKVIVNVAKSKQGKSKKVESGRKKTITIPEFIHERDEGIDMHPDIDEDLAFDGFAESEVDYGE